MSKLIAGGAGNKTELDLGSEVSIPLTFNMADVKNLSSRSGAYSKTIALPGTAVNNRFFGGLYDVNADFTQFNPNVRTDIVLTVADMEVLVGFLQLKTIDVNDEGFATYNVVLFDSTVNFMTDLGGLLVVKNPKTLDEITNNTKSVNDIKFNDEATAIPAIIKDTILNLNHKYEYGNIEDSWGGGTSHWNTRGYHYPLLYTTKAVLNVEDFQPAIYHKTLLDGIIRHHGYTWSGSLKDSKKYGREVIPYTGVAPKESEVLASARTFKAGISTDDYLFDHVPVDATAYWGDITSSNALVCPDVVSLDYTDINTVWNEVNTYTAPSTGQYFFEYDVNVFAQIEVTRGVGVIIGNPLKHNIDVSIKAEVYNDLGVLQYTTETIELGQTETEVDNPANDGLTHVFFDTLLSGASAYQVQVLSPSIYQPYFDLQKDWTIKFLISSESEGLKKDNGDDYNGSVVDVERLFLKSVTGTFVKCIKQIGLVKEWQTIDYAEFIPKKLKQSDIIHDLIARYNCIIYPNPNNINDIIFDIGEEFYSSGETTDWSHKKDTSNRDKITMLNGVQISKALLTYAKASDTHNTNYFDASGEIFGQYEYDFNNDFAVGSKNIKTPFEATPIILQGNGDPALVPALSPNAETAKFRVLHASEDLINPRPPIVGKYFTLDYLPTASDSVYTTVNRYTYPFAGCYNYPLDISLVTTPDYKPIKWESINFGELAFINSDLGTSQPSITLKTLYWETSFRQTSQGKLFTGMFNLNVADLDFIRLNPNAKVYVSNRWWRVNKLVLEANDNLRRLTKVELVSVE